MKITAKNYFKEIAKVDLRSLPKELKEAHDLFSEATDNGKDWEIYDSEKDIQETISIYLEKLNAFLSNKKPASKRTTRKPRATKPKETKEVKPRPVTRRTTKKAPMTTNPNAKKVASVSREINLIKSFVNMLDQEKTNKQILRLLNQVQKYLFERRPRRVYKYATELEQINEVLIKAFQRQSDPTMIRVSKVKASQYRKIANIEVENIAVLFIKEYINLQGKTITKAQVKKLYNRIADAVNDRKITKRNRYWKHLDRILDSLKNYYHNEILTIHKAELNGLQGIVDEDSKKKV